MDATLTELLESKLEWIFVGGKGGVGKTTTSCALATLFATTDIEDAAAPSGRRARRVLLVSTDPAHNLSDAFNQRFSYKPTPVKGLEASLSAMEIDPTKFTHGTLLRLLTGPPSGAAGPSNPSSSSPHGNGSGDGSSSTATRNASPFAVSPEDVAAQESLFHRIGVILKEAARTLPGIDEISVFAEIIQYVNTLSYDLLIFDTAPTGHTLRMLALPEMLNTTFDRLIELEGLGPLIEAASHLISANHGSSSGSTASGGTASSGHHVGEPHHPSGSPNPNTASTAAAGGGGAAATSGGPLWSLSSVEFHTKIRQWRGVMQEVQERFNDPDRTSFLCVCIAEFLSVYETERLIQELMKYNIDCSSIVVNQLVLKPSSEPPCRMCAAREKIQNKYLEQINLLYDDFHVVRMPLLSNEVRGVAALQTFARFLKEPYDPEKHGFIDVEGPC